MMGAEDNISIDVCNIYKCSAEQISRCVMNIVKDREDADDIVQEAWVRYLRVRKGDEQIKIENPQAFLRRIAINLAFDRLRHRRRKKTIFVEVPNSDHLDALEHVHNAHDRGEDRVEFSITLGKVMNELENLPPKCRKAFMLSIFEGQTHLEVSRNMGMSVSMIEKYCRRGLQGVRDNVPNIFAYN